jgi:FkbH-like protein
MTDLPWLPRLAVDFRSRLQSIEPDAESDWGPTLRSLATQFLGPNDATAIARKLNQMRGRRPSPSLSTFRLGLVSNATTDFVKPLLEASALRYGVSLEITTSDFGQAMQEAMDPKSDINRSKPDAVLLAIDHRGLPFRSSGNSKWPVWDHRAAIAELSAMREAFRAHGGTTCLVQTLPAPPDLLLGSLDAGTAGTLRAEISRFNSLLIPDVAESGDVLVDVDWLAQCVGLPNWYDDRYWYLARLPFAQRALPLYADFVARLLAAIRGKSRKCLVLDLDNTLWGGVIGDDGIEGIALDQGDPRGEAFRAIQVAAADLRRRGVVLAVCSKNDEAVAREAFRSHPGMLLKEDDIAVFMVNWDDKATNLERIAEHLDLGLDSMVLLDDNPVERAQVREALPEVAVPELGDDPSLYARLLFAAGYFESVGFTADDLARAEQYKGNADRSRLRQATRNLDEFLRSLDMQIDFAPFSAMTRKRVTQLINKTNQFNVTTPRYTENQVMAFEESREHRTLQVSVRDRFGDNGIIGVVICTIRPTEWEIDTLVMSCRVLNRKVEEAICNRIVRDAQRAGAKRVVGRFVPTARNGIVKDLFPRLGFEPDSDPNSGQWLLHVDRFAPFDVPVLEPEH